MKDEFLSLSSQLFFLNHYLKNALVSLRNVSPILQPILKFEKQAAILLHSFVISSLSSLRTCLKVEVSSMSMTLMICSHI